MKKLFIFCIYVFGLLSPSAQASVGYASLLGGLAFPSTSSSVFSLGLNANYLIKSSRFAVGGYYQKFGIGLDAASDDGTVSINTTTTFYTLDGLYLVPSLNGLNVGLRMGLASISTQASASAQGGNLSINSSSIRFIMAPKVGYDYFMGRFSTGGEFTYFMAVGNAVPRVMSFMGTIKLWF